MFVCVLHACVMFLEVKESIRPPRIGLVDSFELLCAGN